MGITTNTYVFGQHCLHDSQKSYESRKTPVANYYCSWRNWLPIMRAYEARKPSYFATPAVSLIIALHTSLKQLVAAGMDARFAKHREVSARVKDTLDKWGLKLVGWCMDEPGCVVLCSFIHFQVPVSRELAANTLTAVYYPGTLTAADLLPRMSKRNIILAGGLHPAMAAKYFRIGHMGISAVESERGHMDALIKALEESLAEAGHVVGNGNGSKI